MVFLYIYFSKLALFLTFLNFSFFLELYYRDNAKLRFAFVHFFSHKEAVNVELCPNFPDELAVHLVTSFFASLFVFLGIVGLFFLMLRTQILLFFIARLDQMV